MFHPSFDIFDRNQRLVIKGRMGPRETRKGNKINEYLQICALKIFTFQLNPHPSLTRISIVFRSQQNPSDQNANGCYGLGCVPQLFVLKVGGLLFYSS